ncbi:MAG: hypothetical protein D6795_08400 [Deltaproteobacteria bacterium]|nr:MAG: hypothetical protein D6795_08400 [Deltaproteobacteria bacterium]
MYPRWKVWKTLTSSLGALLVFGLASQVFAATVRWSDLSLSSEGGIVSVRADYDGKEWIASASLPYFLKDGVRYTLDETHRITPFTRADGEGFTRFAATYRVPVEDGEVRATLSWNFFDVATHDENMGRFSAWVEFTGPEGDYDFFWRIDPDLAGAENDRLEVLRTRSGETRFETLARETVWGLGGKRYLDRYQARIVNGRNTMHNLTQFYVSAAQSDHARLYVAAYRPGETMERPPVSSRAEKIAEVTREGYPIGGSDIVLWYETRLQGTTGTLSGPDMYALSVSAVSATIEHDRMNTTDWVPDSAEVQGEMQSVASAFASIGVNVNLRRSDTIPRDSVSTNAELHSYMVSHKSYENQDSPSNWYSYLLMAVNSTVPGTLGIMFDDGSTDTDGKPRQGCAIFYAAHNTMPNPDAERMLSAAHEQGHCYNQHHEDYCPYKRARASFKSYSAIMGYSFTNTVRWQFGWNTIQSVDNDPVDYIRPGHGKSFTTGGSYNMTSSHARGHASLGCFFRFFCCR